VEQMWLQELDVLSREYAVYRTKRERIQAGSAASSETKKVRAVNRVVKIQKKAVSAASAK